MRLQSTAAPVAINRNGAGSGVAEAALNLYVNVPPGASS